MPDIKISLGPRNRDSAIIEYVASVGSFNRDIGGMMNLRHWNEEDLSFRDETGGSWSRAVSRAEKYLVVIADEIWGKIPTITASREEAYGNGRRISRGLHGLEVISSSAFEQWLTDSLVSRAKKLRRELIPQP